MSFVLKMMNFALKTCAQIYLASDADLQNSYSSMENIQISIENHRASIENHQFSTRINHHSLENQHTHLGCLPLPRDRSPAAQTQWPQGQFDTLPTLPQKRHQKPVGTPPTHGSKTPEESTPNLPTKPFSFYYYTHRFLDISNYLGGNAARDGGRGPHRHAARTRSR